MGSYDPVIQCLVGLRVDQIRQLDQLCQQRGKISRSLLLREIVDDWLLRQSERWDDVSKG